MSIELTDKTPVLTLIASHLEGYAELQDFEQWVDNHLLKESPYPWRSKKVLTMQQGLNCILRHRLTELDEDTSALRGYLEDSDPLNIWAVNVARIVIKYDLVWGDV